METFTELLKMFNITPDKHPHLILAALTIAGIVYLRYSIGKSIKNIECTLQKVKMNIKAIVTFLATDRPKFDPLIIESMSPLTIKPKGYSILKDSGLQDVIENATDKSKIMALIQEQHPIAKLDVERNSIVLFGTLLSEEFMNPIKTYLYDNPDMQETFMTLAGLFIRDEYLKEHPEITQ